MGNRTLIAGLLKITEGLRRLINHDGSFRFLKTGCNFNTRRAIPHIHYVALSRVTAIQGLHITDLCESKISVDLKVVKEMQLLRNEHKLDLCFTPLYMLEHTHLKICYLNARSLRRHIDDVRKDFLYLSADILIFAETRFSPHDPDEMYAIEG